MELEFDASSKLTTILEKIQNSLETEIKVSLPSNSPLTQNSINQEIIRRFATDLGKKITFISNALPAQEASAATDNLDFVEGQDIAHLAGDTAGESAVPIAAAPVGLTERPKRKLSLPKIPSLQAVPKLWMFVGLGAIGVAFFLFGFLWILPSAEITLSYKPETKSASSTLTAVIDGKLDAEKANIPADTDEVLKTDTASANTTGKKSVGTAAKGRVTIYNHSTSDSRSFFAGTTITSITGGLKFKLDTDVTIGTAPGAGTPKTVGVNVTASNSGPAGNLAANTTFQVGSETDIGVLYAKNDVAFSGGTTKTLTIVSDSDRKALRDQLVKKLKDASTLEIKEKNKDVLLPEGAIETTISKETYDKEIGQEASNLSLTLEVQTKAIILHKEDLQKVLSQTLDVAKGFKVDEENSTVTLKSASKLSATSYKVESSINALLIPNVDLTQVKKELAGKNTKSAKEKLDSLEGVDNYSILVNPSIYRLFGFMPISADKITISLKEEN